MFTTARGHRAPRQVVPRIELPPAPADGLLRLPQMPPSGPRSHQAAPAAAPGPETGQALSRRAKKNSTPSKVRVEVFPCRRRTGLQPGSSLALRQEGESCSRQPP